MDNREKILEQATKYANENWNVHEKPNEHDNAREDFIAGALWAVKNCFISDVVGQSEASGTYRKQKWYNKNVFPLIPVIDIKKANEHNTSEFSFRWLFFTFWSLDSFGFEVAFVATTHWGIGFNGVLPYLRWVIAIPCPEKLGIWIDRKLGRRPLS